jgi:hypothetical protein
MLVQKTDNETVLKIDKENNEINSIICEIYSNLDLLIKKKIIDRNVKSSIFNTLEDCWRKFHGFTSKPFNNDDIKNGLGEACYALIKTLSERHLKVIK